MKRSLLFFLLIFLVKQEIVKLYTEHTYVHTKYYDEMNECISGGILSPTKGETYEAHSSSFQYVLFFNITSGEKIKGFQRKYGSNFYKIGDCFQHSIYENGNTQQYYIKMNVKSRADLLNIPAQPMKVMYGSSILGTHSCETEIVHLQIAEALGNCYEESVGYPSVYSSYKIDCTDVDHPIIKKYNEVGCMMNETMLETDHCKESSYPFSTKFGCKISNLINEEEEFVSHPFYSTEENFISVQGPSSFEDRENSPVTLYRVKTCIKNGDNNYLRYDFVVNNLISGLKETSSTVHCDQWNEQNINYRILVGGGSYWTENMAGDEYYKIDGFDRMNNPNTKGLKKIYEPGNQCDDGNVVMAYQTNMNSCLKIGSSMSVHINCSNPDVPIVTSFDSSNSCNGNGMILQNDCTDYQDIPTYFVDYGCAIKPIPKILETQKEFVEHQFYFDSQCSGNPIISQGKTLNSYIPIHYKNLEDFQSNCFTLNYGEQGNLKGIIQNSSPNECGNWTEGDSQNRFEELIEECSFYLNYQGYPIYFKDSLWSTSDLKEGFYAIQYLSEGCPAESIATYEHADPIIAEIDDFDFNYFGSCAQDFFTGKYIKVECRENQAVVKYYNDTKCIEFDREENSTCTKSMSEEVWRNFICLEAPDQEEPIDPIDPENPTQAIANFFAQNYLYFLIGGISLLGVIIVILLAVVGISIYCCVQSKKKDVREMELDTMQ